MKPLELVNGRGIALLDDADYAFASQWNWCATTPRKSGDIDVYRGKTKPKKHNIFLKRVLLAREIEQFAKENNISTSEVNVDFCNHNTLDLRRENMQIGKRNVSSQNIRGYKGLKRGITFVKRLKGFRVQVMSGEKVLRAIVETELEAKNLWNHFCKENLAYCHTRYDCEYIPLENIRIRKRDMQKQVTQIRSIVKTGNLARNKAAKYYCYCKTHDRYVIYVKGKHYGSSKKEEIVKQKVQSLKVEKPELFL